MKNNLLEVLKYILLTKNTSFMNSIKVDICMTVNPEINKNGQVCYKEGIRCWNCPLQYSLKESLLLIVARGY